MNNRLNSWCLWFCVLAMALLGFAPIAGAQCAKTARTITSTPVYDRAPVFYSGTGWTLGNRIATLPAGTEVRICEEVEVGLFFDKKRWVRIEFENNQSGWAFAGQLKLAAGAPPSSSLAHLALLPEVHAGDANLSSQGIPGFHNWMMFLAAFVFILLGMLGKVIYDEVDRGQATSLRSCLNFRKCIKALIAAPMAFGTFLVAGHFSFADEIAILIFFCMAFQNGFFWQTILPSERKNTATA